MNTPEKLTEQIESQKIEKTTKKYSKTMAYSLIFITFTLCVALLFYLTNNFLGYSENSRVQAQITFNKKQVEKKSNDPGARVELGYAYFLDKDYSSAIEQYQTAINLDKKYYPAYLNLAIVYEVQKKTNKALEMATKASKLAPSDYRPYVIKGRCFRTLKKFDQAMGALNTAQGVEKKSADILYELGLTAEKMGEKENARIYYQQAIDYDPIYKDAINGLKRVK